MHRPISVVVLGLLGLAAGCSSNGAGLGRDAGGDWDGVGTAILGEEAGAPGEEVSPGGELDGEIDVDGNDAPPSTCEVGDDGEPVREAGGNTGMDMPAEASPAGGDGGDVPGQDDGVDSDGEGGTAICNAPACYAELLQDCLPAGACSRQASGPSTSQCYANGVKVIASVDTAASTLSTLVKKGESICYQLDYDLVALLNGSPIVGRIRNGGGGTVATLGDDVSGRSTVTCLGGSPVVLNEGCDAFNGGGGLGCSAGACAP